MKKTQTNIIGVDIGSHNIKLAEMSDGAIKNAACAQIPEGLVRDGEILSNQAMADFISETAKLAGISKGRCAVILPDTVVYSRIINVPPMSEQQLKYSLPYEFRDFVTEDKSRYFYDYAVQSTTLDEDGKTKELQLFTCATPKTVIANYRDMFRTSGLTLKSAAPAASAYANLIAAHETQLEKADTDYCFVELGHSSTDIYMYNGKNYNTHRSLGISVSDIVNAAADIMNVDVHVALTYVLKNYKNILENDACKRVYSNIAVELMKAVNFYNYNNRDNSLGSVYICGGGASVQPLVDTISSTLGLELRPIAELMPAGGSDDFDPSLYARAVGIALQD